MPRVNQPAQAERSAIARALGKMTWEGTTPEERTARMAKMRAARWASHPNRDIEREITTARDVPGDSK